MDFRIDPEFRDVLPTSAERYKALEEEVLKDGVFTDPFITWNGFLIDGHTRYEIMQNHPEVDLKPYERKMDDKLPDRYAVIVWIATHQTSRRNLNEFEWAEVHKKAFDAQKKSVGEHEGNQYTPKMELVATDQSQKQNKDGATAVKLAKDFGVSTGQFKHSVRVGNAMEEAERLVPGAKDVIKSGKTKVSKTALEDMHLIEDEEERKQFVKAIVNGDKVESPRKRKTKEEIDAARRESDGISQIADHMRNDDNRATFDDVLRILNSLEDDFLAKLTRTFESDSDVLRKDDRWPDAIDGFFDSVVADIIDLKGRILK